jgi:hypothetical protein
MSDTRCYSREFQFRTRILRKLIEAAVYQGYATWAWSVLPFLRYANWLE